MEAFHDEAIARPSEQRGRGRLQRLRDEEGLRRCVERALQSHERLRLYYETSPDFSGLAPGAMWEDFKVGIEHLRRCERVPVATDVDWIMQAVRLFRFLIPGMVKTLPTSRAAEARAWIAKER